MCSRKKKRLKTNEPGFQFKKELGMVVPPKIPTTWRLMQEDATFKARLGKLERMCLKIKLEGQGKYNPKYLHKAKQATQQTNQPRYKERGLSGRTLA